MSPLLSCQDIKKSFGAKDLFKEISFSVFPYEKIGIIGPNGSGKSTFMKILAGLENPDQGLVTSKKGLVVGYVPQSSSPEPLPVYDILLSLAPSDVEVNILISKFKFPDKNQLATTLSGGWQKKLDLAKALIIQPDILLLDEPTNHLDLASIEWLENFLKREVSTYLVTSHDRTFLSNVTNRVVEINKSYPKGLFSAKGNYDKFLLLKDEFLTGQVEYQRSLSSKVRREEEWLRTTPQARTTKSRSRIEQAEELISELAQVKERNKDKKIGIEFSATERETKKLLHAKGISKTLGGRSLFSKLDFILSPRSRIGLIGPNGSGKSTLLKVLGLEIPPDSGTIKVADGLKIVYFDQMRAQLPLNISIKDALHSTSDMVTYQGRSMHVNSWGKRFFFSPDRMNLSIGALSGGERARLMIARLMLEPADILLLDEPTNDLDIDTLEVMEESLSQFPGAVILITHDRTLMDNVATKLYSLDLCDYFADYHQYEAVKQSQAAPKEEKTAVKAPPKTSAPLKISFKEKYEYEQLAKRVPELEKEIAGLQDELQKELPYQKLEELGLQLRSKEEELETAFLRWHELDDKMK